MEEISGIILTTLNEYLYKYGIKGFLLSQIHLFIIDILNSRHLIVKLLKPKIRVSKNFLSEVYATFDLVWMILILMLKLLRMQNELIFIMLWNYKTK